jgi:hypothetical protein
MRWIVPSAKDDVTTTLEKHLRDTVDQFRVPQCHGPIISR